MSFMEKTCYCFPLFHELAFGKGENGRKLHTRDGKILQKSVITCDSA